MGRADGFLDARRRRVCVGGALALLCALTLLRPLPAVAAVDSEQVAVPVDAGVVEAREELAAARRLLSELSAKLDAAAASFEDAQAHHLRLVEELTEADEAVEDADAVVDHAREMLRARAVEAYTQPGAEVDLHEAVLVSPDPATAFHRAALVELLQEHDGGVGLALSARDRTAQRAGQQRVLRTGTAGAAAGLQARAEDLTAAVAAARDRVAGAEGDVASAEREAIRRADQRRAAEARRRAATADGLAGLVGPAASVGTGTAPAPVDGKVCPVGTPNGFIDSWGYPRSGGRRHKGVDIFAAHGTPLYAVADGTIQRVWNNRLGGLSVNLLDADGHRYYYAHLASFAVEEGQRVRAGDVVGTVGNTGNARSTPPHLHWQYHPGNGPPVNPFPLAHGLCRG